MKSGKISLTDHCTEKSNQTRAKSQGRNTGENIMMSSAITSLL